jgi:uncharacterized membrane protein YphA (DoxX/SURF4 family)
MNVFLWIVQALLAVAFLLAGSTKIFQPKEKLTKQMAWAEPLAPGAIKAIGAAEVLGALGVVLPWATGIAKVLTPIAAVGLAVVMIGAIITHVRRKEYSALLPPTVLLVLSVIVAIGRF